MKDGVTYRGVRGRKGQLEGGVVVVTEAAEISVAVGQFPPYDDSAGDGRDREHESDEEILRDNKQIRFPRVPT